MPDRESPRGQVAEEIRVELARAHVSGAELARQIGMSQSRLARRLIAQQPFNVDELYMIADVLGVPAYKFLGGPPTDPRGPGRGRSELPRVDSNHQPAGYRFSQVSGCAA